MDQVAEACFQNRSKLEISFSSADLKFEEPYAEWCTRTDGQSIISPSTRR